MENKYSRGITADLFLPIRELIFNNSDLLLVSSSSRAWTEMGKDSVMPSSLFSFLLELLHIFYDSAVKMGTWT